MVHANVKILNPASILLVFEMFQIIDLTIATLEMS
jgi:hypothetical protein